MCLVLVCTPPSHALVQMPYVDQAESVQSIGHATGLQAFVSVVAVHPAPLLTAATKIVRVRDHEPVPQVALHVLKPDHVDIWQSTSHTFALQSSSSASVGHATPEPDCIPVMERERCFLPVPHSTVQGLQAEKAETVQSASVSSPMHAWVWQSDSS